MIILGDSLIKLKKPKTVVWDLFGGGCNSFTKMLIEKNIINSFEVYTFDVVPVEDGQIKNNSHHYLNCDLSVGINKEIKNFNIKINNGKNQEYCFKNIKTITELFNKMIEMKIIKKPNIIISSTLCQSFSNVLSMVGGGTCFWKKENKGNAETKLIERTIEEFNEKKSGFTKNLNPERQLFIKKLGQQCVDNTIELIRNFAPNYWYIENPYSSLIWFYIKNNKKLKGHLNKCGLSNYGYPIDKTTGFYSNIKMELNENRIDKNMHMIYIPKNINGKNYFIRKGVPTKKIKGILSLFDKREKLLYFSKGLVYEEIKDKKLTANNFYTFWEPITKKMHNDWLKHVEEFAKKGSAGDKRVVKKEDNKYFRRWYVEIGFSFGEKGHYSLKKTCMTLGKLKNSRKYKNESDFTTRQLNEASESSHLPHNALYHVLQHFKD